MERKIKMPKPQRCCEKDCKKKLGTIKFTCHCKLNFCSKHRLPENHNCQFDYVSEGKKKLKENNPVVVKPKVIQI